MSDAVQQMTGVRLGAKPTEYIQSRAGRASKGGLRVLPQSMNCSYLCGFDCDLQPHRLGHGYKCRESRIATGRERPVEAFPLDTGRLCYLRQAAAGFGHV